LDVWRAQRARRALWRGLSWRRGEVVVNGDLYG
jgi:hypothetical protein